MRVLASVLLLLAGWTPGTPTIVGCASVIDGDTIEIHGQRIRLWGVDAPESRQLCGTVQGATRRCGTEAASALDHHLQNRTVSCFQEDRDRYDRMVARCEIDGADVGAWLVRRGLAVRYTRYAGPACRTEEDAAKAESAGGWAGEFVNPEEWRRSRQAGRSTVSPLADELSIGETPGR